MGNLGLILGFEDISGHITHDYMCLDRSNVLPYQQKSNQNVLQKELMCIVNRIIFVRAGSVFDRSIGVVKHGTEQISNSVDRTCFEQWVGQGCGMHDNFEYDVLVN